MHNARFASNKTIFLQYHHNNLWIEITRIYWEMILKKSKIKKVKSKKLMMSICSLHILFSLCLRNRFETLKRPYPKKSFVHAKKWEKKQILWLENIIIATHNHVHAHTNCESEKHIHTHHQHTKLSVFSWIWICKRKKMRKKKEKIRQTTYWLHQ